MAERNLTVIPVGGLANRMLAMTSAYELARDTQRSLTVIWQKDAGLNASFFDLFTPLNEPIKIVSKDSLIFSLYYEIPRKKNLYVPKILHKLSRGVWIQHLSSETASLNEEFFLEKALQPVKNISVTSCYPFYDKETAGDLKKIFHPSDKVEKRIDKILSGKKPDIALQIRRTDNQWSIDHSPTFMFEEIVRREIAKNPDIIIYLATDDQDTKFLFKENFSRNIIFNPSKANRDTFEGMIDGAAEMFIMAKCHTIYGSFSSTYSYVASLLGDACLEVVKLGN